MRSVFALPAIAAVLLCLAQATADAGYCGATSRCGKHHGSKHFCKSKTCCCTCQTYCIVMKTCKVIEYEEQPITCYKTVYEEVIDKYVINTVEYVEAPSARCAPCTIWQEAPPKVPCDGGKAPCACGKPDCCGTCAVCPPPELQPTCILRKCVQPGFRCVPTQKVIEKPRVVVKQVPYTVIQCIPHEVCKQVPVKVCCPVPCCCKPCPCQSGNGQPQCDGNVPDQS
jgi:hypothetical protein